MTQPLVNIIVVTYNQYEYTKECLTSLLNDGYENKKIFLVDNASEPDRYDSFLQHCEKNERLEFIRSEKNLGFGYGCNLALEKINSGYIVFLNNDTAVEKNWLPPIINYMENHPEVGACQPKIKDMKNKDQFEYAGAAGGFMDIYGYPFTRGRIFYTMEKDEGQYDNIIDVVWCSGTAMVTKKEIIEKTGFFDTIFFMYGEEADLCWKINHVGYKLAFIPQSIVYHHGGGTMRKIKKSSRIYFLHRNGLILLLKNYSGRELAKYFTIRVIFDLITFFYYLANFELKNSYVLLLSYVSFLKMLPQIQKGRKETRELKSKYFKKYPYPLYRRSIILDYFFLRKKKFTQLNPKDFLNNTRRK